LHGAAERVTVLGAERRVVEEEHVGFAAHRPGIAP
jgi:hypothetical protein